VPEYDTVFSFPDIDEEPETERGVLLMGFGPERLLAGLGAASGEDPVVTTLVVDRLRHDALPGQTFEAAVADGVARWRAARPRLTAATPGAVFPTAALRKRWTGTMAVVIAAGVASGAAQRVYLAACWLRRAEIDKLAG
jgi:hypothetical protein